MTKFVGVPSRTTICQRAGPQKCLIGSECLPLGGDFEIYTGEEVLGPRYVKKMTLDHLGKVTLSQNILRSPGEAGCIADPEKSAADNILALL